MAYVLTEIFSGIYQLNKKNNKIVGFFVFAVLGYLIGFANPTTTTDYPVYEYYYNYGGATGNFYFEKGYSLISKLFYDIGFNYQEFRILIAFCGFLILFIGISRFTNNIVFVGFIYGLTIFFNDATQVRNFLMIALVILGLSFLKDGSSKKNFCLSLLFIIIAGQIHSLGYAFIIIPFLSLIPQEIVRRYFNIFIIMFTISLCFLFLLSKYTVNILVVLSSHFTSRQGLSNRLQLKYSNGTSGFLNMLIIVGIVIACLAMCSITLYLLNRCTNNVLSRKLYVLFCGLVFSMLTTPLLGLAIDYSRISRGCFLFFIIVISIYLERKKDFRNVDEYLTISSFIIICIVMGYVNTIIWGELYIDSIPYLMKIK